MHRFIIEDKHHVPPFNEVASQLTIGTQPLKILHENMLLDYFGYDCALGGTFDQNHQISTITGEAIVYRDNLWFDVEFLTYFMDEARRLGRACRAAFAMDDRAFRTYSVPLAKSFEQHTTLDGQQVYLCDLWYFPNGYESDSVPIIVPSDYHEIGFYSVPDFMTMEQGDLTHFAPMRAIMSIETWVHVYFASVIYGTFGRAGRLDKKIQSSVFTQLKLLWRAVVEQKQVMTASGAVEIGEGTVIDPSAIITGPAKIGRNCSIGAGAIIDNCTIGDNVTIDAGCVLFQSTVANNCFLPFRAALYLTAMMENSIVAQNTCLQMCVIGRNSFVGAGNTFTDFNLLAQKPIRAANREGVLEEIGQIVLGSGIGHNCRIGSGMVVFPGRMIESDVVLVASPSRRVISRSIDFQQSDHLHLPGGDVHRRFYPSKQEEVDDDLVEDSW